MERDDQSRPSVLRGLWSFGVGGLILGVLLTVLDPATELKECPQYIAGGNGDFSAFRNSDWDFYLPALVFVWLTAVIVEQGVVSGGGNRAGSALRTTVAIGFSVFISCCGIAPLLFTCRT